MKILAVDSRFWLGLRVSQIKLSSNSRLLSNAILLGATVDLKLKALIIGEFIFLDTVVGVTPQIF